MKENSQRAQCFQLDTWKLYFRHSVCCVMLRDVPRDALERELPHQHPTPPHPLLEDGTSISKDKPNLKYTSQQSGSALKG